MLPDACASPDLLPCAPEEGVQHLPLAKKMLLKLGPSSATNTVALKLPFTYSLHQQNTRRPIRHINYQTQDNTRSDLHKNAFKGQF